MTTVALQNVSFAIGGATLVDNIELQFQGGAAVAIVGPNGAGKSTLMRLLSGDLKPSSGRVLLADKDVHAYPPRELAERRAILSQHINVAFPFSVEEIVRMGAPDTRRSAVDPLVDAAFDEAELSPFRLREFPTLSGGEQQRAHFARALLQLTIGERTHGKGLLLLDEPTSSLDLRHQIKLLDIARARADGGACVIAVLHDLNLAARFATRIVLMHGGRVIGDGRPEDVMTAERIRQAFGVSVTIGLTEARRPYILQQDMQAI